MKILRKRLALSFLGMATAATAIGVPAAVVFATKTNNASEIGKNIKVELQNSFLNTINIIPVGDSGEMDSGRLKEHIDDLAYYKNDLKRLQKEYAAFAKTKIPVYGIINDVLESAEKFSSWTEFTKRSDSVINAINTKNWDKLSEILFDDANNGKHKILSKTYGIERNEISGADFKIYGELDKNSVESGEVQPIDEKRTNEIKYSFLSFEENISNLKNPNYAADWKISNISQIISALNMISGNRYNFDSSTGGVNFAGKSSDIPTNSIVYFINNLKEQSDSDPKAKSAYDIWENQMIPAWRSRYRKLELFFNDKHDPFSKYGLVDSTETTDAYHFYETQSYKYGGATSFKDTMSSFLSGDPTPGLEADNFSKWGNYLIGPEATGGSSNRFLSNWQFLRIFFGHTFEAQVLGKDPASVSTGDSTKDSVWAWIKSQDNNLQWNPNGAVYSPKDTAKPSYINNNLQETDIKKFDKSGSTTISNAFQYWSDIVENIFDDGVRTDSSNVQSQLPPEALSTGYSRVSWVEAAPVDPSAPVSSNPIDNKGHTEIVPAKLWDQLHGDTSFEDAYQNVVKARSKYDNELESLGQDRMRIGINLKSLSDLKSEFHIKDNWSAEIDSFTKRSINENSIDAIKSILEIDPKTKAIKKSTKNYDIIDGYVYPNNEDWMISTSDTIKVDSIELEDGSKLKKWEKDLNKFDKFQPEYKITENDQVIDVKVQWKIIKNGDIGGWND